MNTPTLIYVSRLALPLFWRRPVTLLLLAVLLISVAARAQNVPAYLPYQGYLADTNGNPLGAAGMTNYNIIFRLWNGPAGTGTNELFAEVQTVTVYHGSFSALLGAGNKFLAETNPPIAAIFTNAANASVFVEITVQNVAGPAAGATVTVLPRLQLLSVPNVFLAQNAIYADAVNVASSVGSSNNPLTIALNTNMVSISVPVNVAGTVIASNLSLTGAGIATNVAVLNVQGAATMTGLNVAGTATAATLSASNAISAGTANISSSVITPALVVTNKLLTTTASVAVQLASYNLNASNTVSMLSLSAGSLTITNQLSAGGLSVTNLLSAATLSVTNLLSAATLTVTGTVAALNTVNIKGGLLLTNGLRTVSASEPLRIVSGSLTNNFILGTKGALPTTITAGAGLFVVTHTNYSYLIAYAKPFSSVPVVCVTSANFNNTLNGNDAWNTDTYAPMLSLSSTVGFIVTFLDFNDSPADQDFDFTVFGSP